MGFICIRTADHEDRDFVIATAERLADFGPPPSRPAHELVAGEVRTLRTYFANPPAGTKLIVAASDGGERLGFAYLEPVIEYFKHEKHGHLGMIAVTKAAEGRGVGGALLAAAEEWCRDQGYRRLTLNVFENNHGARAVYERRGYVAETIHYVKVFG